MGKKFSFLFDRQRVLIYQFVLVLTLTSYFNYRDKVSSPLNKYSFPLTPLAMMMKK